MVPVNWRGAICPVCAQGIYQCEACGGMGCDQCENGILEHSDAFHLMNYLRALKNVEELLAENAELKRALETREKHAGLDSKTE